MNSLDKHKQHICHWLNW